MEPANDILKPLTAWARTKYDKSADISGLKRLSGGASQETWAFDVVWNSITEPLILRRAPGGSTDGRSSEALPLAVEARLLALAADAGVPAPNVKGVFAPGSDIGESFVMNRVEGETIARKILRDEAYATARCALPTQCGTALAGIHSAATDTLTDLPRSDGLAQIARYEDIYRSLDLPRPTFELALQWLKQNAPAPCAPVLVHGDFRLGNLIVDDSGLTAVLDWELAHIGDPREDIAWICVNSWRFGQTQRRVGGFGDLAPLLDAYVAAGGARFTEADIDWWETLGSLKWGIMCMIMYESYRSGAEPTVERAAIGRRVSETEIDLLNLIEKSV